MRDGYQCISYQCTLYTQIGAVDIIIGTKWYVTTQARINLSEGKTIRDHQEL